MKKIIGCTGHRDLGKMTIEKLHNFMKRSYQDFTNLHCISGGAVGFDIMFAEWCLSNSVPYSLYLAFPFETHTCMWNEKDKSKLKILIENAQDVSHESEEYSPKVYLQRDRKVVDNSEEMVAYWNGINKGGTAYTVKYANKQKKLIKNCYER